ncbi:MAG: AAA family ATPase [Candidatus Thermoplasmatota archaeon]|nr:AAA family ATPase [Candidatus Thermoplasmatota archaeon]
MFPPYFSGRKREIEAFEMKLNALEDGTAQHMAIIGEWAIGKTSLLRKFEEIAAGHGLLTYYCVARFRGGEMFSNIVSGISAEIQREFGAGLLQKISKTVSLESLSLTLFGLKGELKFSSSDSAAFPFREYIVHAWNEIKDKKKGIVILIDDLDTVEDFKETMLALRAASMEVAQNARLMFVIAGAPVLFDKMYDAHAPLVRFFEPLQLSRLNNEEAKLALTQPLKETGKKIDEGLVTRLLKLCSGHPYYIQEFGYYLVEVSKGTRITEGDLELGFRRALNDVAIKIFDKRLSEISKTQQKVLSVLTPKKAISQKEIADLAGRAGVLSSTVRRNLRVLKEKGFLNQIDKGEDKGKYIAEDSLLIEYLGQIL